MERLKISNVSISNGSREEFQGQIYCKKWFSDRVLYRPPITIADADIRSLKSLCTLFDDKYLDHILVKFEQNRMVRTVQNFYRLIKNS